MHKLQLQFPTIILILGFISALLFLPPFLKSIINLGNLTGMIISLLLIAYGRFFTKINTIIITFWKKPIGKIVLSISGILCILILLLTVIITICLISAALKKPPRNTNAVVLGCAVHGTQPSLMLQRRLKAALSYLEENPSAKAVLSGGKGPGEAITEAQCMFEYLTEHGISKNRLYLEDKSENTAQNIEYSKEILQTFQTETEIAIITNEFHQYRASILAKKAGLTPYSMNGKTLFYLLPTYYIRELYAVLRQWIVNLFP